MGLVNSLDRVQRDERNGDRPGGAGDRVDRQQGLAAGLAGGRDDPAVVHQRVVGLAEPPERPAELSPPRQDRPRRAVAVVAEVPEAALVGEPGQHAGGRPLRLDHRDPVAAGDLADLAQRHVAQLGDIEPGRIPRHGREVPGDPGQPLAVPAQPRIGDKVAVAVEHLAGPGRAGEPHDRVAHARRIGVVLAHGDQAAARQRDRVGVAVALGRQRLGRRARRLEVELLVAEMAEPDPVRRDDKGGAAVFVDTGARVETLRSQLARFRAVLRHDHQPPALGWPGFEPIELAVRDAQFGDADRAFGQAGGGDRRGPGPVRTHLSQALPPATLARPALTLAGPPITPLGPCFKV